MGGAKELRIYLNREGKIYRAFKIEQHANDDLTITPTSAVYLPRSSFASLGIGEQFEITAKSLNTKIHHYSAHAVTGQRHIKETPLSIAIEPIIGKSIQSISSLVPLATCVVPTSSMNEVPATKGKWFGITVPSDVNYVVFDIHALPKDMNLAMQYDGVHVQNDHMSQDNFGFYRIEMRDCSVVLFVHMTNHEQTDILDSVFFQQDEGRTLTISRVEKGKVLTTVSNLIAAQGSAQR